MQEPRQLSKTEILEILLALKREHLRPLKISIFQVPEIINEAFYYKIKLVFVSTELSKTFTMISRTPLNDHRVLKQLKHYIEMEYI